MLYAAYSTDSSVKYISEGDIRRGRMVSIHTDFQDLSKENMERKTAGKNLTK